MHCYRCVKVTIVLKVKKNHKMHCYRCVKVTIVVKVKKKHQVCKVTSTIKVKNIQQSAIANEYVQSVLKSWKNWQSLLVSLTIIMLNKLTKIVHGADC